MKIFGMLAAGCLCAAMLNAQHARIAAAKPAGAPAAAKPAIRKASKPAANPARLATDLRIHAVRPRPIVRRWTPYWQTYCFNHPLDSYCQEHDAAVGQTAASPEAPSVLLNPYATAAQPPGTASMLANPTVSRAPATRIVKVSDELATGVAVGASQADVLQKLGQPPSRISGDVERYTYFLESGGSLKLDFEDGHVTEVRKTSN